MKKENKRHKILEEGTINVPRFTEAAGFYTSPKSSSVLRKVKAKDTKPELKIRKAL
ncbi:very short patch repair endonuclease [Pontibacter roseus]|uniref:very short patch repair endonuclease n=1 Tax=Pontibacter roseus TaxID=336989 RepID=UPI00039C5804|nr:very short patch repair endonuclease [Pontibacter roseus]